MSARKILIIDDEPEVCLLLTNYLRNRQKEVQCASSLQEGMEKFRQFRPDHLLLDNNLPDGFGVESIGLFREIDPHIHISLISARSDLKEQALAKGAEFFIEKPISFSVLNQVLEI